MSSFLCLVFQASTATFASFNCNTTHSIMSKKVVARIALLGPQCKGQCAHLGGHEQLAASQHEVAALLIVTSSARRVNGRSGRLWQQRRRCCRTSKARHGEQCAQPGPALAQQGCPRARPGRRRGRCRCG